MVSAQRWLFGAACACVAAGVFAQTAATPPVVDESKLPEWVKRQARSPYKVIIESQTVKPRPQPVKEDEGTRRVVKKAAHAAPPIEVIAAENASLVSAAEAAATPADAGPDRAGATAPAVVARVPPVPTPPAEPVAEQTLATARPLAPEPVSAPVLAVPQEPAPLQLLDGGDPVFPADLFDSQRGRAEVVVAFTVNPNGEVSKLAVVSSSNARLNRSVLRAVQGWRYAPIAAPREHRVSFGFTPE